jgi:hypothetical protein
MDLDAMTLRMVGGASLPRSMGTLTATWPLAVLTASDEGVAVDLRPSPLKRMVVKPTAAERVCWSVQWPNLSSVDFGRRSIILRPTDGKGCRFVTLTRQRILPLIAELERRKVPVTRKKSTIGWFAGR